MPGSAGSSWYFLRYCDPHNDKEFANFELLKHWMPVDFYIGGKEHLVGHLLYSRFWNNFLYDKGLVPCKEPFKKLFHQGMILGEDGTMALVCFSSRRMCSRGTRRRRCLRAS